VGGLPAWGRLLLLIAALPGIVLAGLSILALGVSILALLLLTVPAYKLVLALSGGGGRRETVEGEIIEPTTTSVPRGETSYAPDVVVGDIIEEPVQSRPQTGRRTIDVTIVE